HPAGSMHLIRTFSTLISLLLTTTVLSFPTRFPSSSFSLLTPNDLSDPSCPGPHCPFPSTLPIRHLRRGPAPSKVPTVADIQKQLRFPPNGALFWSGDRAAAAKYATQKGLKTMDMAISGPTPWNTKWLQEPKIRDEYWDRASTAM
ncbi:MAG: hypothetical protein Q9187_007276, partial [Circinaria calcarea]